MKIIFLRCTNNNPFLFFIFLKIFCFLRPLIGLNVRAKQTKICDWKSKTIFYTKSQTTAMTEEDQQGATLGGKKRK